MAIGIFKRSPSREVIYHKSARCAYLLADPVRGARCIERTLGDLRSNQAQASYSCLLMGDPSSSCSKSLTLTSHLLHVLLPAAFDPESFVASRIPYALVPAPRYPLVHPTAWYPTLLLLWLPNGQVSNVAPAHFPWRWRPRFSFFRYSRAKPFVSHHIRDGEIANCTGFGPIIIL